MVGLFYVAIIHAFVSLMFAFGFKSYLWYASFLASVLMANAIGHMPDVYAYLTKKD